MTQNDDTSPNEEHWLSAQTITYLKSNKALVYPESVSKATSIIITTVDDNYERDDNAIEYLSETVVQTLQKDQLPISTCKSIVRVWHKSH